MILVRSAFWLVIAYIAIGPQVNIASAERDWPSAALNAGARMVVSQVAEVSCLSLECLGTKIAISSSLGTGPDVLSLAISPRQNEVLIHPPVPRPRLARMG